MKIILKIQNKETGLTTFHKVALTYPLLLGVLLKVKKKAWAFSMGKGICFRIESELKDMGYRHLDIHDNMVVHRLMRSWNEFSGDIAFPIHTSTKLQGYEQFTQYGKARHRLLDHMIKECERIIAKENQ